MLEIGDVEDMIDLVREEEISVYNRIKDKEMWEIRNREREGNNDFWMDMEMLLIELNRVEGSLISVLERMRSMEGY